MKDREAINLFILLGIITFVMWNIVWFESNRTVSNEISQDFQKSNEVVCVAESKRDYEKCLTSSDTNIMIIIGDEE